MKTYRHGAITRTAAGLAIASLSVLSLSACGASGEDAAEGPAKLRVSVAPIQFETAYVAKEQGMFEKHGLDVEIVNGADPASQLAQVVSGDVDIATGSWINVSTSVAQGVPVRAVAGNGLVDAKNDNSGVMVAKDSGITELSGLAGKTIGVVGVKTGSDIPLLQAVEAAGLGVQDIKEVAIPYAGMQAALEQHTVDAVVPSDTFYHQMVADGFVSLSNPIREYQGNQPGTVWVGKTDWLASNDETASKFVDSMTDAVAFYEDPANLEEIRKIHAQVNQIDVDAAPKSFVPASVKFNVAESQSGIDAMVHFGLLDKAVTVQEVLWEKAPRQDSAS